MTGPRRRAAWTVAVVLGMLVAGCGPAAPLALPTSPGSPSPTAPPSPPSDAPVGTLRVAYPDVPATWNAEDRADTAAVDLAALWSLPLYRYDPEGQLVPGLAVDAAFPQVPEGWAVDLALAEGAWSDGSPVTAEDVVATVEALREARPEEWSLLESAEVRDARVVRLGFSAPYGRWADLLTGPPGVLPAAALADGGLAAFAADLPVVGGRFTLEGYDAGRSASFAAHTDGPLGPPRVERLEVLFVPSYETALGLLDRGDVDVVLGHLAVNPVERARQLPDVRADAPLGGTSVSLEWLDEGSLGDAETPRRDAFQALALGELVAGLLSDVGESATSPVPGVEGPLDAAAGRGRPSAPLEREIVVLVPRWHEALGFTARAIQRDLTSAGASARLVAAATPELLDPVDPHDGVLRIRRDGPRPVVAPTVDRAPPGPVELVAEELAPAFQELADDAWQLPLYRIAVAHAWAAAVEGVEPSSWPGLGLWNAGDWVAADVP